MIAAFLSALLALAGDGSDEFTEQLALLAAPHAAERAAAERWLQAHLVFERYPELAAAARGGDAEVRGRLARVLSSDRRHLALALALSAEKDAELSALGREAVRAGVASSDTRLAEPAQRQELEYLLRRLASASPPRNLRLDARLDLAQMVAGLELVGELPLGLTLDARIATKTIRREEELPAAPWNELLLRVAGALGVELEIYGLPRGRATENPVGAFLRLTAEQGPPRTGVDLVSEWLFVLAKEGDESARTRAACNLASSGFAPALEWMDQLVRTRADPAALEGLLLAAAGGRVASALTSPAVLPALLAAAEAQAGPRSARILCALARGGCFDAAGEPLVAHLCAGFEDATPRARWARLFLLEKNGCVAPEVAPLARGLLAEPSTPAALRLQALYTLAMQGETPASAPLRVEGLPELFRLDQDAEEVQRLGRVLRAFSLPPPFPDPARIPGDWTPAARLGLLQAWLWRGETEAAAAHVVAWLRAPAAELPARGEALANELLPWCARGSGPLVAGVLERVRALEPGRASAVERVRLLLGLVPAADVPGVLGRGGFELAGERADLALLGALAGYPVAIAPESEARSTLMARLFTALGEQRRPQECAALIAALQRTARGLYAARRDELGDTFANSVQALCSRSKTELGRWFERQAWLTAPSTEVRDVSRAVASFAIPAGL